MEARPAECLLSPVSDAVSTRSPGKKPNFLQWLCPKALAGRCAALQHLRAPTAPCTLPARRNGGSDRETAGPLDLFANNAKNLYHFTEVKVGGHSLPRSEAVNAATAQNHFPCPFQRWRERHPRLTTAAGHRHEGGRRQRPCGCSGGQRWPPGQQRNRPHWDRAARARHQCLEPPGPVCT